jgi:hypothetical protein
MPLPAFLVPFAPNNSRLKGRKLVDFVLVKNMLHVRVDLVPLSVTLCPVPGFDAEGVDHGGDVTAAAWADDERSEVRFVELVRRRQGKIYILAVLWIEEDGR